MWCRRGQHDVLASELVWLLERIHDSNAYMCHGGDYVKDKGGRKEAKSPSPGGFSDPKPIFELSGKAGWGVGQPIN